MVGTPGVKNNDINRLGVGRYMGTHQNKGK